MSKNFEDKKPKKKLIHINISEDLLETSNILQQNVIKDGELTLFEAHTGSKNSWYCYIFGMGLKKAKEDIEKFKEYLNKEK